MRLTKSSTAALLVVFIGCKVPMVFQYRQLAAHMTNAPIARMGIKITQQRYAIP